MTDQPAPLDDAIIRILQTKAVGITRKEILDDLLNAGHAVRRSGTRGNTTTGQLQTISSKLDAMKRKGLLIHQSEGPNSLVYWSLNPERYPPATSAPAPLAEHPPSVSSVIDDMTDHLHPRPNHPRDHLDALAYRFKSPSITLQIQINPDVLDTLLQLLHQLSCVLSDDIAEYLRTLSETLHNAEELS